MMHEDMQYVSIQGQGHEPFKVQQLSPLFTMAGFNWTLILKLEHNL